MLKTLLDVLGVLPRETATLSMPVLARTSHGSYTFAITGIQIVQRDGKDTVMLVLREVKS